MTFTERLLLLEADIEKLNSNTTSTEALIAAQKSLLATLAVLSGIELRRAPSLSDQIDAATRNNSGRRNAALIILRTMGLPGLIPANDTENQIDRRIVELIKSGAPDVYRRYIEDDKIQTYQKIDILKSVHTSTCEKIHTIKQLPRGPDALAASRNEVLKTIKNKVTEAYLAPFGLTQISPHVEAIFQGLEALRQITDHTFGEKLSSLQSIIDEQLRWTSSHQTFLTNHYYRPFLENTAQSIKALGEESRLKAICSIDSKLQGDIVLEKRYPLEQLRIVQVSIPLWNTGPGVAIGVIAKLSSAKQSVLFAAQELNVGDIPPGDFAVAVELMLERPAKEVTLRLELHWGTLANADRQSRALDVKVLAQATDIDWASLEKRDPYSTTIAEGREFVGRREKVATLTGRLLKDRMQSSYITGQKRIGKSSLALAVRDSVKQTEGGSEVEFLYLEYGEYAHSNPADTLSSLGERIAEFLQQYFPPNAPAFSSTFTGTLAPLSRIADALAKLTPQKRFVVILDEFDEIPTELYRMGPLAETFFANLRTLSGKKNLAFMLVGGENMPFIVSAQGDQLNKFVRESLNYFSRSDEWSDYVQLVTSAVSGTLRWHEDALNKVFTLSNGHPYYTKLICSKVYSTAVHEKDTDITASEVSRAYERIVSSLDTNSFAHLWKDGIQGTRDEVEVIALQRCRLLVALGRIIRMRIRLTLENIRTNKHSPSLRDHELAPMITDLCRRGILEDNVGEYSFTLPLFRDWTAQSGINKLIADSLGDELASSVQKSEDDAFVKDGEISEVIRNWSSYRGRPYTVGDVRAWLNQVPRFSEQRLLFKLLQNLRFFSEMEIREKLRVAHSLVLKSVPEFIRRSMSDRRRDILVTYVDGAAKSGQFYASRYAEENLISSDCVKEMANFAETLQAHEEASNVSVNGLVVVDDFLGTGRSLSENLKAFFVQHADIFKDRSMSLVVVALCATQEGESRLREALASLGDLKADLRICEPLSSRHFPFSENSGIWDSTEEQAEAKALCLQLGSAIAKSSPLGYGQQGALIVFPQTCPNNSLPILHASKAGKDTWKPLFPRPKN